MSDDRPGHRKNNNSRRETVAAKMMKFGNMQKETEKITTKESLENCCFSSTVLQFELDQVFVVCGSTWYGNMHVLYI